MIIKLPHINYRVKVRRFKKPPQEMPGARAYTERIDKNTSRISLPVKCAPSEIAHEVIHVLRYICRDRYMEFTLEEEHMAYMTQYLVMTIMGGTYA